MLFAASIRLTWNENKESDLLGYRIYYGTTPGNYDHCVDVYNATRHNLSGLDEDAKYHLAITAYDTQYEESTLSPEITTKNVFFRIHHFFRPSLFLINIPFL